MPAHTITIEKYPRLDPRLGRHRRHDSRAFLFPHPTAGLTIQKVRWERVVPIFDQGNFGSCTANAGLGMLGTAPYYTPSILSLVTAALGGFNETAAQKLYSAEETLDGDGPFPPQDNGSSGLTCAQVLRAAGLISGWTQTFTLEDALKALTVQPFITGIPWYNSMFTADADGFVTVDVSSGLAGGHEIDVLGYDPATDLVEFANSWGTGFGVAGHFWMKSADYGILLSQDGDTTIFTPVTQSAPQATALAA